MPEQNLDGPLGSYDVSTNLEGYLGDYDVDTVRALVL